MRKLVWFAVGFVAACVLGAYFVSGWWLLLLGINCLCAAIPLIFLRSKAGKAVALAVFGCAASFLWFFAYGVLYLNTAREYDGRYLMSEIEVMDYSHESGYGIAADGRITLEEKPYLIRIYINDDIALKPGDRVTGAVRLWLTTDDGRQGATFHQGNGMFLLGQMKTYEITPCEKVPFKYFPKQLRAGILELIDRTFPEDTVGFARALLLGDSEKLPYDQNADFQVSGIRHVIAVSGLHVSILLSLVYLLSGHRRYLTVLIGIPVLIVFAALEGFTPSVIRACIMQGIVIFALLFAREYDPPTALAAAVVLMLTVSPMTITSISFQLSVGCMVGIFLFSTRIKNFILRGKRKAWAEGKNLRSRLIRWSVSSVSVTLSAMITTTPLCAALFGTVSLVGVITNLLTLWIISFVFYGIMLTCVAGALWLTAGKVIAWIVSWAIRYILLTANVMASIPGAAVYTASAYIVIWLVLCYLLLAVFLLSKRKHPIVLSVCMIVGLMVAQFASWIEPRLDPYRFTVFDVGQGQCVLFQCDGKSYLVDCGGDNDAVVADQIARQLLSQGIVKLDGAIVTHYDRDHVGALGMLLHRVGTDTLYLPDTADKEDLRKNLEETYADKICLVTKDMVLTEEAFSVTLFSAETDTNDNESGLGILFQAQDCDILITGDRSIEGEAQLLEHGQLPELELLVVGHHGADASTGTQLLVATKPKQAVISVGEDNAYNHPSQTVCDTLNRFCDKVWRTDLHGTILFRG